MPELVEIQTSESLLCLLTDWSVSALKPDRSFNGTVSPKFNPR